jgi:Carboxypeptidase regulatory-like domain
VNRQAYRVLCSMGLFVCLCALPLAAAPDSGKITGVVVDPGGTPQMGATVLVSSEELAMFSSIQLLTNDHGRFSTATLPAGFYSIKVTLAGFLPAMEQHVQVTTQRPTLLEVAMGSVFSSIENLRRPAGQQLPGDDWAWVLRASTPTRSVLQWQDTPGGVVAREVNTDANHGRMVVSSGADHPGSISNVADSPATSVVYDMGIGTMGQLVMAGQFSHEGSSMAGGFATEWLPSGEAGVGPATTLVVRQSQTGPGGVAFRGLQLSHEDQLAIGDRVRIRYGGEYMMASLGKSTAAVRPHGEVAVKLSKNWQTSAIIATHPWEDNSNSQSAFQSALNSLDEFPTLMLRHGSPVLENNLHEEVGVQHILGNGAEVSAAVFHDRSTHTAVIGRGPSLSSDFLQDYFSTAFAYDGGVSESTGVRAAYRQKIASNVTSTLVYAYDGALAPIDGAVDSRLRSELTTKYRHSVAARVSTTAPGLKTQFSASYKWLSGPTVSHQDMYGESLYHIDPYLSLEIRQPLPNIFPGHMEVQANVGNLLGQGYVTMATSSGQVVLVPSYRYFRGGLSFQF